LAVQVARSGFGLAFVPEFHATSFLADGSLVGVLEDWCPSFAGSTCTIRAGGRSRQHSP